MNRTSDFIEIPWAPVIVLDPVLEEIVTNYSKDNSIDMVINSNHVIYSKSELDITNDIITYFKENDLYVEMEDFATEMQL